MDQLDRLGTLGDPTRRALYRLVAESAVPVGRDAAAAALGISRALAAFHLDRLVEGGLLDVEYRRLTGRTGPGAGRPAKLYRAVTDALQVSLPPRRYDRIAELLAAGIEAGEAAEGAASAAHATRSAIDDAAGRLGHRLGAEVREEISAPEDAAATRAALVRRLSGEGFRPQVEDNGTVFLSNCPFDSVARDHRPTVCRANLALVDGLLDEVGASAGLSASLEPDDHRCCVVLRPS